MIGSRTFAGYRHKVGDVAIPDPSRFLQSGELTGSYSLPWVIKEMGQDRGVESPLRLPYRHERQEPPRSVVFNRPVQRNDC